MGSTNIQHGLSKRFQFRQILFLEMGAVYPCKLCPFSLLARMKIEEKKRLVRRFLKLYVSYDYDDRSHLSNEELYSRCLLI